jgi:hypothetical protein
MQRNSKGYWRCHVKQLEYSRRSKHRPDVRERERKRMDRKRAERRERGVCVYCGAPRLSETMCWDCLNKREEARGISI